MFEVKFNVNDPSVDAEQIEGDLEENLSFDIEDLIITEPKEGGEEDETQG